MTRLALLLGAVLGLGVAQPVLAPTPRVLPPVARQIVSVYPFILGARVKAYETVSQSAPTPEVGDFLDGTATWYCGHGSRCTAGYPGGMYAAAGPALRTALGPGWRGQTVTVSSGGHSVTVQLIDCLCGNTAGLIDLYADVVVALGLPLSSGVYLVRVTGGTE